MLDVHDFNEDRRMTMYIFVRLFLQLHHVLFTQINEKTRKQREQPNCTRLALSSNHLGLDNSSLLRMAV